MIGAAPTLRSVTLDPYGGSKLSPAEVLQPRVPTWIKIVTIAAAILLVAYAVWVYRTRWGLEAKPIANQVSPAHAARQGGDTDHQETAKNGNSAITVGGQDQFNIELRFLGEVTARQRDICKAATNRWTKVIVGDLPSLRSDGELIDDLLIVVQGSSIDGPGGILGQAAPTRLRPANAKIGAFLPIKGILNIDSADIAKMEEDGSFEDFFAHEVGRILGIGTIWSQLKLIRGAETTDPVFIGKNAEREYAILWGRSHSIPVPVENSGGPGTRDSGWRESVFRNELMTGFLNPGPNVISRITIGALQDMGYTVNYVGESFRPPGFTP